MVNAICQELIIRKDFTSESLQTVYFGGGTPSLLNASQMGQIMDTITSHYTLSDDVEITLEANPEDLTTDRVGELVSMGINRLSIGIQSFIEEDLRLMNRAHSNEQSHAAIVNAIQGGITNLSIDLMFGLVGSDNDSWHYNLEKALSYSPGHISCYNLTIEEQTAFDHWIKKKKITLPHEDIQYEQFLLAHDILTASGYDHYEISNYALPGAKSKHNTSYWNQATYLGVGPAAHSYKEATRYWNVADNQKYLKSIETDQLPIESEILSLKDIYNETIMLALRTSDGLSSDSIGRFPTPIREHFEKTIRKLTYHEKVIHDNDRWHLPVSSWYQSDAISSELFYSD